MSETRLFDVADQRAFAMLSGDFNPLHLDPVIARRTLIGAPVVHGMNLVLWALESVMRSATAPARVTSLTVSFRKPVLLDAPVSLVVRDRSRIEITSTHGTMVDIRVGLGPGGRESAVVAPAWADTASPDDLSFAQAAAASGRTPLAIDSRLATSMFPTIVRWCGVAALAELLALTRIVGMSCPGRQSLFAGLSLVEHNAENDDAVAYQACDGSEKYSLLRVRVSGPTLRGKLETFYRRPPVRVPMAEVLSAVSRDEFVGQRALVVGGTRGLGEAFAKALCAGGARVCFTYARGEGDARAIEHEVRESGGIVSTIPLDVRSSPTLDHWPFSEPPTHLYYLATPTLHSIRKGAPFDPAEVNDLITYFVTGFDATIKAVLARGATDLVVWSPSTVMLSTEQGGVAYCIAKAAMEELGRHLPQMYGVTVRMPRLDRVDTDQTMGLVVLPPVSALDVALAQLRELKNGS